MITLPHPSQIRRGWGRCWARTTGSIRCQRKAAITYASTTCSGCKPSPKGRNAQSLLANRLVNRVRTEASDEQAELRIFDFAREGLRSPWPAPAAKVAGAGEKGKGVSQSQMLDHHGDGRPPEARPAFLITSSRFHPVRSARF